MEEMFLVTAVRTQAARMASLWSSLASQPLPHGRVWCTCVTSVVAEEFNYCVIAPLTINLYTEIYYNLSLTSIDSVR